MSGLDHTLRACLDGSPPVGQLDQAFLLLTVDPAGAVDVCLLSRAELRAARDGLAAVVASRRALANLDRHPVATVVVVCDDTVHSLVCRVTDRVEGDGASAVALAVERHGTDGLGIELQPLRFRVEDRLRIDERWEHTDALLAELAGRAGAGDRR